MVTVVALKEFDDWLDELESRDSASVAFAINLLRERGVKLPFPYSSAIQGSSVKLRELRVQSGGRPLRVFYAFDPKRQAVLLLGGDKTGDDRFYKREVPKAERLFAEYLRGEK